MIQQIDEILRQITLSRGRPSSFDLLSDLEGFWRYHQQTVIRNWHFYLGLQQFYMKRFDKEDDQDYLKRTSDATIENHIGPIIDLMVSHLYGKQDGIKRYTKKAEEPYKELNDLFKYSIWSHGNQITFDDKKALNTLVTGYSIIQRRFLDLRTMKPFQLNTRPEEMAKYGIIAKVPLDSAFCIPLPFIDNDGYVDGQRLGGILYIAEFDNFVGHKIAQELLGRQIQKVYVIEYIDDQVWLRWRKYSEHEKYQQVTVNPGTEFQNRNQYGDVMVPFTVYRNTGDPFYIEGDSDVKCLETLNMELNTLANGDKDVIFYHQNPVLVGLNGADLPANFVRTKNAFVGLKGKDARFEYLTWEGKLDASRQRQEEIRRVMSQVSGISLISRGFLKEIGQIRSGPPLKALFTSDRAVMSRKFRYFRQAEMDEMRADVRMYMTHTKREFDLGIETIFHADFTEDFLGIDALLEEEIKSLQIQSGSEDIREIIKTEHPDWSDEQISTMVKNMQEMKSKIVKQKIKSPDKQGLAQE